MMQQLSFSNIPSKYESMCNDIFISNLKKFYSNFSFQYLTFWKGEKSLGNESNETKNRIRSFLIGYFKDFYFLTYHIIKLVSNPLQSNLTYSRADIVICVENQCLIIEHIDLKIIEEFISNLKERKISMINTGIEYFINDEKIKKDELKNEISSFCSKYVREINRNKFVKMTISPIAGYLIRRFFYPTNFFKNPSFFDFDSNCPNERINKSEFNHFLNKCNSNQQDYLRIKERIESKVHFKNFDESEFIKLRALYSNSKYSFTLVIHIESLYIFMMKELNYPGTINDDDNEKIFCEKYKHRCFVHFYGFLTNKRNKTIGFIYEYMCNDTLNSFIVDYPEKCTQFFSLITINRLLQGIYYLHSNSLFDRDIKPLNILIDHDFIPFICDFETIQHPYDENDPNSKSLTKDICTMNYAPPELFSYINVSYPADIFSFGLVIYFLFEKKNMFSSYYFEKKNNVTSLTNSPKYIQMIFEKCIKLNQEDRITARKIRSILSKRFCSFKIHKSLFTKESSDINLFIYETLMIQKDDIMRFIHFINKFFVAHKNHINDSDILYNFGNIYLNGNGVEQDFSKAKKYYESSFKKSNYLALFSLGNLYFN